MHGKCQEMTPGRMCSFILPSQPGLLYVPAAYGEVLRADQAHILTQDRFYWNLYDNNFLFRLSKTQDHGMRQSREIEASISFLTLSHCGKALPFSLSQLIHWWRGLPQTLPRLLSSLRSSIFHYLEPWQTPVWAPGFQLCGLSPFLSAMPLTQSVSGSGSVGKDLVPLYRQCSLAWLLLFLRRTEHKAISKNMATLCCASIGKWNLNLL